MATQTRLVLVGAGLVGRRHAEVITHLEGVHLAAVVDPSDAGRDYAHKCDVSWYATLEQMFACVQPDGVILATPTPLHVEQGLLCITHGCPVLVEKPLATTAAEALRLVRAAELANVPLLVGHHRRYNPLIQRAHRLIADGAIGNVRAVNATCWFYKPDDYFDIAPWRKLKGAGPISVNMVHDVDLIRYLCGEIESVHAQAAPSSRGFENEELAAALLTFDTGAVGTISVSDSVVSPWSWELTAHENPVYPATNESSYLIGGSSGALSVPNLKLWQHDTRPDWWKPIQGTSIRYSNEDPLVNQMVHFLAVIAGEQTPLVSGQEGMRSLRVVEAIQQSAQTRQTVFLNSKNSDASNKSELINQALTKEC